MLVGCAGLLSLDTVLLGVVRAYLPRLECSEVVGSNNLDLDSVSLVVQTDDPGTHPQMLLCPSTLGACISPYE